MKNYDESVTLYTAICQVTREGWQWGVETSSHSFDKTMRIYMDDEDERVYIDYDLCWQKVCELNGEGSLDD